MPQAGASVRTTGQKGGNRNSTPNRTLAHGWKRSAFHSGYADDLLTLCVPFLWQHEL